MLYVTTELDKTISVIDPHSLKIVGTIPTGQAESHMLAISHDGRRGYTANVGPGTVSVLDMTGRKTVAMIPISGNDAADFGIAGRQPGVYFGPDEAAVGGDRYGDKQGEGAGGAAGAGYGTAPTKDGRCAGDCAAEMNQVAVVDLKTMKVAKTIDVPRLRRKC